MENLKDQKIVIAGGTSGIGLATAKLLSEKNATVIVTSRSAEKVAQAKETVPGITAFAIDSADPSALNTFFSSNGAFDHLIITLSSSNGAGPFATLSLQELREAFDGKFWPHLNTIQAALPFLKKSGSITVITAASATCQMPGTAGLAALNGGLEIIVPILAKELKPLRVNAVSPGVIDTPWWNFLGQESKTAAFEQWSQGIAVGRVGKPEEVAKAILQVVTNEYINGTVLNINGGLS